MARIAVAGFQHETNTFAPQKAAWVDFERADVWPAYLARPGIVCGGRRSEYPDRGRCPNSPHPGA